MTKALEGSRIQVSGVGLPTDLPSLMQLGLSPSKLA